MNDSEKPTEDRWFMCPLCGLTAKQWEIERHSGSDVLELLAEDEQPIVWGICKNCHGMSSVEDWIETAAVYEEGGR